GTTFLGFGSLSGGEASFTTTLLSVGTNAITATYLDTPQFTSSTSAAVSQAVNAVSTTTTITGTPSGVLAAGQTVSFTAHVTSSSAAATPNGYVLFYSGSTPLGFAYLSQGDATFTTSALAVGNNAITAQYLGTGNLLASTSAPLSKTVNSATTSTTITSSSPSGFIAGQSVTFTATVANVTNSIVPTGYVAFFSNSTTLLGFGTLVNGVATYTTTNLPIGTVLITAQYLGTNRLIASTSSPFAQVVNGPSTPGSGTPSSVATTSTTITSAPSGPVAFGQGVTYTATVNNLDGAPIPTGTVGFYLNGTTFLGYSDLINGVASFATALLPVGNSNITAQYLGTSKFAQSTSAPFAQSVTQVSTTTSLASSTSTPTPSGQTVIFTATVANSTTSATPTGSVATATTIRKKQNRRRFIIDPSGRSLYAGPPRSRPRAIHHRT
ncbi:Ig-like domain-containing protein, partial [Singulisphaera rosea]